MLNARFSGSIDYNLIEKQKCSFNGDSLSNTQPMGYFSTLCMSSFEQKMRKPIDEKPIDEILTGVQFME